MTAYSNPPVHGPDKAITLAMRLAHADEALHSFAQGQVDAVVGPHGDAYLLRRAQIQLRHNEARLGALIEAIADGIVVVNRGGRIVFANRTTSVMLGFPPTEFIGQSFFQFVHEDERAWAYTAFFKVIEGIMESATIEFRCQTASGSFKLMDAAIGRFADSMSNSIVISLRPLTLVVATRDRPLIEDDSPVNPELATPGDHIRKVTIP